MPANGNPSVPRTSPYRHQYLDLHLHLDGALTLPMIKRLASLSGVPLPYDNDRDLQSLIQVSPNCTDLTEFLKCINFPCTLLQTKECIREAVSMVLEQEKESGVIYSEIRFAPQRHTEKGLTQEEVVLAALEGMQCSAIKSNLILCCLRGNHLQAENEETLRIAAKYLVEDNGVVALDLAGAEALYPIEDYRELFRFAKAQGIPFTLHAGEAGPGSSIHTALDYGALRIGHGVRAFEDPTVLERLVREQIPLEMCPTSNKQTRAISDMSQFPLRDYLRLGIPVTLNTDDPGIEGTDMISEYLYMENVFGLTEEEEEALLRNSIRAAFTSEKVKKDLLKKLGLS